MADDFIYCPSCRHKLQLPPELYGQTVECPQCHTRFAAPVPQAAPPAVRPVGPEPGYPAAYDRGGFADDPQAQAWRAASSSVKTPAIILLITSLVGALLCGLVINSGQQVKALPPDVWEKEIHKSLDQNPRLTPEQRTQALEMASQETVCYWLTLVGGVGLASNLLTLLGAVMMLRFGGYALAVLGTVAALNPINVGCCVWQVPLGLWGLIVLLNGDVRRAFR